MPTLQYILMSSLHALPTKGGLLGAAIATGITAFRAGTSAYRAAVSDPKFPTDWRERSVPVSGRSSATVVRPYSSEMLGAKRRWSRKPLYAVRPRRYGVPGKVRGSGWAKRLVRTGNPFALATAASQTVFGSLNMNLACKTSDLTGIYRYFRLRKVVLHMVPRVDPANSGLANNFQCMVATCCDPEDDSNPASITDITAYDNSYQKLLHSSDSFKYTFYPKVKNSVSNGGTTVVNAGGYGTNPWLTLDSAGTSVPHFCLKYGINSVSSSTITFTCYYEYHFDVKGIA